MGDETTFLTVQSLPSLALHSPPTSPLTGPQGHNGTFGTQKNSPSVPQTGGFSTTLSDMNKNFLSNLYPCLEDFKITDATNEISIGHLNIRSLRYKIDEIVSSNLIQCTCLAISESWLDASIPDEHVNIDGFKMYRLDRGYPKGGGGVIIYIKNNLISNLVYSISTVDIEGLWVNVRMNTNTKPIILGCVYRRPKATAVFDEQLDLILQSLPDNHCSILVGDVNYDSVTPTTRDSHFFDLMESLGYKQLVTMPTRVTDTTESLIDHIYTNNVNLHTKTATVLHDLSDHFFTYTALHATLYRVPKVLVTKRSYKHFQEDNFMEYCSYLPFYQSISLCDINEKVAFITNLINDALDIFAPVKTFRVRPSRRPWISNSLLKLISFKNRLFKHAKSQGTCAMDHYKKIRNWVNKILKQAKRQYILNQTYSGHYTGNKQYQLFNFLMGRGKKTTDIQSIEVNNTAITDKKGIANVLNSYFANVGTKISNELNGYQMHMNNIKHNDSAKVNNDSSKLPRFQFKPVSTDTIFNFLSSLDCRKGSGIDGINNRVLRLLAPWISEPLTDIINSSLQQGVFPDAWKHAVVTPIFKGGSHTSTNNYRPISITPALSRILEKVVNCQLEQYIEGNNLLSERQHGFRRNRSTETLLLELISKWRNILDAKGKRYIGIISLDISKAFDTVQSYLLLNKLYHQFYLSKNACKWFQSYLHNRVISTKIANTISKCADIKMGVPQGSILGPKLFNLFINDLELSVQNMEVYLYADDCLLFCNSNSVDELLHIIETNIPSVLNWYSDNRLKVNAEKTQALIISTDNCTSNLSGRELQIGKTKITTCDALKYLGMSLDSKLSLTQHVKNICSKTVNKIRILQYVCNYLPISHKVKFYTSYIRPCLEYYGAVLYGINQTNIKNLERMQKWAIRIMRKAPLTLSSSKCSETVSLPTLESRREYLFLLKVHKFIYSTDHQVLSELITVTDNKFYSLRSNNSNNTQIPKCNKTNYGMKALSYLTSKAWNRLPIVLKKEGNLNIFRRKLRYIIYDY
jgi:hypothetical protein